MANKEEDETPLKKAMLAMGWDISSGLPMANEENRHLLDELQRLYTQKTELMEIDKQNVERVNKLQQHTKNAENTINHNLVSFPIIEVFLFAFNKNPTISRNFWMLINRKCETKVIS